MHRSQGAPEAAGARSGRTDRTEGIHARPGSEADPAAPGHRHEDDRWTDVTETLKPATSNLWCWLPVAGCWLPLAGCWSLSEAESSSVVAPAVILTGRRCGLKRELEHLVHFVDVVHRQAPP